jgi:hypothetical protein
MNQVLRVTNLTQGVINLSGQSYTILPGKFIEVPHIEVPNLMSRIQLFQRRGWISATYVSENGKEGFPILEKPEIVESPEEEYLRPTAEEKEVIGAYEDSGFASPINSRRASVNEIIHKGRDIMNGQNKGVKNK